MELSYPISNSKPLSIHLSIQKILFKFIINKNNVLSIKSESGLRTKNQTLRASFFMSEILALSSFSRVLTLLIQKTSSS